jgi:F-type H+-transporting ATPase subunit epsilon
MGILPHHSATLTALAFGEVMVRSGGQEEYFAVGGGFAEIQPDKVIILANSAEQADEIDLARAEEAQARARQAMAEGVRDDPQRYAQIEAALRRAQIRIDVRMRRTGARRVRGVPTSLGSEQEEE